MSDSYNFYLAPIRGITDNIFRNTFEKYFGKFDFLMAPFIPTVKAEIVNPSILRDINPCCNDTNRLIPQIIGNNPQEITLLACRMNELGYRSININMGCPHAPVTRKKRGSGLLPYPDMVRSILEYLTPKLKCSLSVKLRLGLENQHDIDNIIPVLNDYPLSEVIIHPRTGSQMYKGFADLDSFERALDLCKHTTVYNGDIFSIEDFICKCSRFPQIKRWMIGRGILKRPFLLQELQSGNINTQYTVIKKFHDEILELNSHILCGDTHLINKMKGLWFYLSDSFTNSKSVLKKIQKTSSLQSYIKLVSELFDKNIN